MRRLTLALLSAALVAPMATGALAATSTCRGRKDQVGDAGAGSRDMTCYTVSVDKKKTLITITLDVANLGDSHYSRMLGEKWQVSFVMRGARLLGTMRHGFGANAEQTWTLDYADAGRPFTHKIVGNSLVWTVKTKDLGRAMAPIQSMFASTFNLSSTDDSLDD
jgi:hypothetical protein